MVTIDAKLGIAVYRLEPGYNPGRFMHFIETSIEMLIHEGISRFVIDFSDYPTLSTRELMSLVKLTGTLPPDCIMLSGVPEFIVRLLNATGLVKIFRIFDDVQSAIKSVISAAGKSESRTEIAKTDELSLEMKPASA